MASAKPGVHVLKIEPNQVPESLIAGEKVLKWDEELSNSTPCTLKVDKKAFYLYWVPSIGAATPQYIDICLIRDTRTGKYAKSPKLQEAGPSGSQQTSTAGPVDTLPTISSGLSNTAGAIKSYKDGKANQLGSTRDNLEDKTLTICTATDFVNLTWTTFVFDSAHKAKLWTDELLKYSRSPLAINGSALYYLEKIHARITLTIAEDGLIPLKGMCQLFAQHKEDKKKVLEALGKANINITVDSSNKKAIELENFTFQRFIIFYLELSGRNELTEVIEHVYNDPYQPTDDKVNRLIEPTRLRDFLNEFQRDPRLNEILYPFMTNSDAENIIRKFEPDPSATNGKLSFDGLLLYLLSEDNLPVTLDKYDLSDDMSQPMSHYFINSSHNTYLTGHQMTSQSSVEIYRQILLSGCRCIELDCWPGDRSSGNEPMITHGFTVCTEIPFKDVIEAIAESAFKTSDYPVILSFENHVNRGTQQQKMARYCREIFGDLLLDEPFPEFPLKSGYPMPSPANLMRKIIIKNNKNKVKKQTDASGNRKVSKQSNGTDSSPADSKGEDVTGKGKGKTLEHAGSVQSLPGESDTGSQLNGSVSPDYELGEDRGSPTTENVQANGTMSKSTEKTPTNKQISVAEENTIEEVSDSDADDDLTEEEKKDKKKAEGTAHKEVISSAEMSCLVNYCTPVPFHSFEYSKKLNRSHEMSSFVETVAMNRMKKDPVEFVNYNKRQLSRIYPRGTRVDSSNYMPQVFWNAGCQLVALNFQTLDLPMQLNQGIFERNLSCGFLLKPVFMRRMNKTFDPFAESTVDGIVAGHVSIRIISGYFLSEKQVGTYVEAEMYGLPTDTVRRRFRTKMVLANGINPKYDTEEFVFKKVVLPHLATLRLAVYEERGKLIGHRVLPVSGLCPGYRYISLRNEVGQPLLMPALFVFITVKDYVPDDLSDLASALSNPIAYQSNLEKHAIQPEPLTSDFGMTSEAGDAAKSDVKDSTRDLGDILEERDSSPNGIQNSSDGDGNTHKVYLRKTSLADDISDGMVRGDTGKDRLHMSEENLDRADDVKPVPLTGITHATSMPQILVADGITAAPSKQNITAKLSVTSGSNIGAKSLPTLAGNSLEDPLLTTIQKMKIEERFVGDDIVGASKGHIESYKLHKKALVKQEQELKKIEKKHKKALGMHVCAYRAKPRFGKSLQLVLNYGKTRRCEIEKLLKEQEKEMKKFEKKRHRSLRVAAKNGTFKQLRHSTGTELTNMKKRHEHSLKSREKQHVQLHLDVYRDYYTAQMEARKRHAPLIHQASLKVLDTLHAERQRTIDKLHDKQKSQVLSLMHSKLKQRLKEMQSKHKDKHEMDRLKREFQSKHVASSVNVCKWLEEEVVNKSKSQLESNVTATRDELTTHLNESPMRLEELCKAQVAQKQTELERVLRIGVEPENSAEQEAKSNGVDVSACGPAMTPIVEEEELETTTEKISDMNNTNSNNDSNANGGHLGANTPIEKTSNGSITANGVDNKTNMKTTDLSAS